MDKKKLEESFQKSINFFANILNQQIQGTGEKNTVENSKLTYLTKEYTIKQIALVTQSSDKRSINITPHDKENLKDIEKILWHLNIGNVQTLQDKLIINLVQKTKEYKLQEISKLKTLMTKIKGDMQSYRADARNSIKELKNSNKSEHQRLEKEIEIITKDYLEKIEDIYKDFTKKFMES